MTSRYEDKFLIPLSYFSQVESLLDCGCIAFNKPYPSRIINSIYYDTDDFFFAKQNSDGDGIRSKVRLRYYNNCLENSNIEVKYKHFSTGKKLVIPFPLKDQIPAGFSVLDKLGGYQEIDLNISHSISPKLYVRYKRSYWVSSVCQNLRITLDSGISARQIINTTRLDTLLDYNIPFDGMGVLEVKYASKNDITSFRDVFQRNFSLRRSRFSKYVLGLIYTSQVDIS